MNNQEYIDSLELKSLYEMDINLKLCPFCGRTDTLIIHEVSQRIDDTDIKQYTVICNTSGDNAGCGANCGYRHFTKQDAVKAWNKRAEKIGRWIFEKGDGETCVDGYICSACGESFHTKVPYFSKYNFCPNCGAKMEGEAE